jgi:hypothetical protein
VPEARTVHVVADNLNTHWHHDTCAVVAAASCIAYDPTGHVSTAIETRANTAF